MFERLSVSADGHQAIEERGTFVAVEVKVMIDGRKGNGLVFANDLVVADAHDGDVLGNAQSGLQGGGEHLGGVGVIIRQDAKRFFGGFQPFADFS